MTAFYNELDSFAADWLERLAGAGHISPGRVERKSIKEVSGDDIQDSSRVHLFAGIGGWELALRLAGWPATRPVWTGSCPCQPFSAAGKRKGQADDRHLWPDMFRLIRECRPDTIFGEQVASAIGHGWLDGVFADLESEGYACGAIVLGAHSVGAPHIRQRLWWVADAESQRESAVTGSARQRVSEFDGSGGAEWLGDPDCPDGPRLRPFGVQVEPEQEAGRPGVATHWQGTVPIRCADGKSRPVKPGIQPLAHGLPGRVGLLRGAGNAIVPQVAAEFIKAFMECQA